MQVLSRCPAVGRHPPATLCSRPTPCVGQGAGGGAGRSSPAAVLVPERGGQAACESHAQLFPMSLSMLAPGHSMASSADGSIAWSQLWNVYRLNRPALAGLSAQLDACIHTVLTHYLPQAPMFAGTSTRAADNMHHETGPQPHAMCARVPLCLLCPMQVWSAPVPALAGAAPSPALPHSSTLSTKEWEELVNTAWQVGGWVGTR